MSYDLIAELKSKNTQLDQSIEKFKESGKNYALAYRNYRVELAKELMRLRDKGLPASLVENLARGNPEIAELKQKEILSDTLYEASRENINVLKLQIKILNEQISREWAESERNI